MRRDLLEGAESFCEERIEHRGKHQREDQLDDRVALDDESDNRQDYGEECSCGSVQFIVKSDRLCGDLPVIAARVGAFAKGTATRCVQLARDRPVRM